MFMQRDIAVLDLARYKLEGEQPYRPYSGVLHLHRNRYKSNIRNNEILNLI